MSSGSVWLHWRCLGSRSVEVVTAREGIQRVDSFPTSSELKRLFHVELVRAFIVTYISDSVNGDELHERMSQSLLRFDLLCFRMSLWNVVRRYGIMGRFLINEMDIAWILTRLAPRRTSLKIFPAMNMIICWGQLTRTSWSRLFVRVIYLARRTSPTLGVF